MRLPREHQFDPSNPPWLHCLSRCVRRAFLCGEGLDHRKQWLERRLALLSRYFTVQVGAYAIMSNHLHVVSRPRPQGAAGLSAQQVAEAWWAIRENVDFDSAAQSTIQHLIEDEMFITRWRARLGSVSWFMKALKEPLSRMANREDDCSGTFWEGRFRSIPLLDPAAIVTCMAYVDLNPIRAQLAQTPEASDFTSVKSRIVERAEQPSEVIQTHFEAKTRGKTTRKHSWLTSVEEMTFSQTGDPGLSLDQYLTLVDTTGRYARQDKPGAISDDITAIILRLDSTLCPQSWLHSVTRPQGLRGSALGSLATLAVEAQRRGLKWLQTRCAVFARNPKQAE